MPRKGDCHLTPEQRARIVELHRLGRPSRTIAGELSCSIAQVRQALKKVGLKPSGSRDGRRRSICSIHADELREWARSGLSLSEMARRIGTDHHKVASFFRRHGIEYIPFRQSGENNPAWKGGRQIDKTGYVLVLKPDHPEANRHGYVREHRLAMEQALGRPLRLGEVVHHKDGDRRNNDPSNLELFATNGRHLEATLAGKCPDWSEEGRQRLQGRWNQFAERRRAASQSASARDGQPCPKRNGPKQS